MTTGGVPQGKAEAVELMAVCRTKPDIYSDREVEFLRSIAMRLHVVPTSAAQLEWLRKLAAKESINFDKINSAALAVLPALCARWLSDGTLQGKEWSARNPRRADGKPGSFMINVITGKWADFATGDKGGDPVSLAAYLFHDNDQYAAATDVKRMLGI